MTPAKLRTIAGRDRLRHRRGLQGRGRAGSTATCSRPKACCACAASLGTEEQLAGVTFRKNNFGGRDKILTIDAFASTIDYDAYDARTVSLVGTYERVSTLLFQKPFSYSGGLELVATARARARRRRQSRPARRPSSSPRCRCYAQLDTSDDLLDPTQGFRVGVRALARGLAHQRRARASTCAARSTRATTCRRATRSCSPRAAGSAASPARRSRRSRRRGGSTRAAAARCAATTTRASARATALGDPTGGRSLVELSVEARIRTGLFGGALGVVPFVDAGTVGEDADAGLRRDQDRRRHRRALPHQLRPAADRRRRAAQPRARAIPKSASTSRSGRRSDGRRRSPSTATPNRRSSRARRRAARRACCAGSASALVALLVLLALAVAWLHTGSGRAVHRRPDRRRTRRPRASRSRSAGSRARCCGARRCTT